MERHYSKGGSVSDWSDGSFVDDSFMIPPRPWYSNKAPGHPAANINQDSRERERERERERIHSIPIRQGRSSSKDRQSASEHPAQREQYGHVHWASGSRLTSYEPYDGHHRYSSWPSSILKRDGIRNHSYEAMDNGSVGNESQTDDAANPNRPSRKHQPISNVHKKSTETKNTKPQVEKPKDTQGRAKVVYDCYPWSDANSDPGHEASQSQAKSTQSSSKSSETSRPTQRHDKRQREARERSKPIFTDGPRSTIDADSNVNGSSHRTSTHPKPSVSHPNIPSPFPGFILVPALVSGSAPIVVPAVPNVYYDARTGLCYFVPPPSVSDATDGMSSNLGHQKKRSPRGREPSLNDQPDDTEEEPRLFRVKRDPSPDTSKSNDKREKPASDMEIIRRGLGKLRLDE